MADVKEMADTLAEQLWNALADFMNQRPDDLTDDHIRHGADMSGVPMGVAEYAIKMIDSAPLPPWPELGREAQEAWWYGVVYRLMPILAGWSGEIQRIHLEGRN